MKLTTAILLGASLASAATLSDSLQSGKAALQSAGPLAFGPEGILFVGDTKGAAIFAFDTSDQKTTKTATPVDLQGLGGKIGALVGVTADQILVNDLAVNPLSKNIYLSVSRGKGPEAIPVIVKIDGAGKITELKLENIRHASVALPNAPAASEVDRRGQSKRQEAITDLAWADGRVLVAGLSNEEFSSNLRAIPFPFRSADQGASVEIFHGAHGRFETNSPVRTFVPYQIAGESYVLAAYTCTPLVKLPMSSLKSGAKVKGTTIAELGNGNRPLDMVVYQKEGKDFILMNNSSRGVMKLPTNNLGSAPAITAKTDITGVPYETLAQFKGVEQLDRYDAGRALMLVRSDAGSLDLKTVALP